MGDPATLRRERKKKRISKTKRGKETVSGAGCLFNQASLSIRITRRAEQRKQSDDGGGDDDEKEEEEAS